jgi:hypothetical protein
VSWTWNHFKCELAHIELVAMGRRAIVTACSWPFQVLVCVFQLEWHIFKLWEEFGRVGESDTRKWKNLGSIPMMAKVFQVTHARHVNSFYFFQMIPVLPVLEERAGKLFGRFIEPLRIYVVHGHGARELRDKFKFIIKWQWQWQWQQDTRWSGEWLLWLHHWADWLPLWQYYFSLLPVGLSLWLP